MRCAACAGLVTMREGAVDRLCRKLLGIITDIINTHGILKQQFLVKLIWAAIVSQRTDGLGRGRKMSQ
jgi:hypothetical protein